MKTAQVLRVTAALCTMLLAASVSHAQPAFPSHPITLIVPTAPGGGTDIATRFVAAQAEKTLGQKILVVNKPGASGAIGVDAMLQAPPDGYTIAAVFNSPVTITPQMFKVDYTMSSMTPVVLLDTEPLVYCVPSDFPANDGKQLIAVLKSHPNKYTYGTDGVSGVVHFAGALIFSALGVQARAIPYGGAGETLEAFLSHSVDIYGGAIPTILPYVQKGTAKCLIVSADKRDPALPNAASVTDLGIPQAQTLVWHAIVAPSGIPKDVLATLEDAFQKAAQSPEYQAFALKQGEEAVAWDSARTQRMFDREYPAFGKVIQALGLANTSK